MRPPFQLLFCCQTSRYGPATHLVYVQSVDLSALGAQALAQVEKARKAAAESLASALNQKPKLDLTLELDAPKIAIPVPATEDGRGMYAHLQLQLHHSQNLISRELADTG